MASTYSDLKFELIGTGEQSGTWGTTTNTNLGTAIEEAITGSADVTFASATVTLTLTNTNASQTARNLRLNLTGTSGGAQDLEVPAIEKFYIVNNGCADTITVKVAGQTGVGVPAGKAMLLFNNGTDVVDAVTHFNTASVGTLTLTNALAVASGGTGATTADGALTNLGGTTTGKAVFTAADAAAGRTALGGGTVGGNVFAAATAAAAQQAMDTEVGVDVQAYDVGLADIAGLAVTDGNFIVGDGANWVAESGATARTSLGLGTLATLNEVDASTIQDNSVGAAELNVPGNGTAGQYLQSDGDGTMTWADVASGATLRAQVYTTPGTWTRPANTNRATVTVIGGGGSINGVNWPAGANSGGTSSFGSLATATGGAATQGPNAPTTYGASGNGSVSAGTLIYGGAVDGEYPGPGRPSALMNGLGSIRSVVGSIRASNTNAFTYSINGGQMAGVGAANSNLVAGFGGVAIGDVPVSAPQPITVGGAGNAPGPGRDVAGSCSGVVVVEWVE